MGKNTYNTCIEIMQAINQKYPDIKKIHLQDLLKVVQIFGGATPAVYMRYMNCLQFFEFIKKEGDYFIINENKKI